MKEGARAVLLDSKLSTRNWPYAVMYMAHIKNRVLHSAIQFRILFELWHKGIVPRYNDLRPFGCPVVICDTTTTNPDRNPYSPSGIKGRFLGYSLDKKAFIILRNDNKNIVESRDMITLNGVPVEETQGIDFITEVLELFDQNREEANDDAPPPATDENTSVNNSTETAQLSDSKTPATRDFVCLTKKFSSTCNNIQNIHSSNLERSQRKLSKDADDQRMPGDTK